MLTIARLRLFNWKPFRGEHILDLQPKAYAVFARDAQNDARSNWLGKSSLLEAIDFALYGRLADEFKNRRRGWISRGEKSGEVELTLSDGSRIVRSQQQSGSERLWYFPPGVPEKGAVQQAAQQVIDELVGLSKEDFAATRYFRQGEMARLITLDPGPRLDLVAGWLRLGKVQECEDDAADVLREVAAKRDEVNAKSKSWDVIELASLERAGAADFEGLQSGLLKAQEREAEARLKLEAAQTALDAERSRADVRSAADAYERTVEQGTRVWSELTALCGAPAGVYKLGPKDRELIVRDGRTKLAGELREADAALAAAGAARGQSAAEAQNKHMVASGRFGGTCPLVGAPCPARAFVEGEGTRMRGAAESAQKALGEASLAYEAAAGAQSGAATRLQQLEAKARRLGELRAEAARLRPAYDAWRALSEASDGGIVAVKEASERARVEYRDATERVVVLQTAHAAVVGAQRGRDESRAKAEGFERTVRVAAAAAAIFGKGGAQRRMAEISLAEIEEVTNEMLAVAEIPLTVEVRWSREGSGAASACSTCGDAFPRSEKIKVCARCGADRGQQIINALTVVPSASSGGARDLAGIALQLAASEWLSLDRESRWACALLDEPLSALDDYHRKALGSHLPTILKRASVEQSFVIAHHASFLDALPARIVIESKDGWSRATVQA